MRNLWLAAFAITSLPFAAAASVDNPLLGEWQAEGAPYPAVLSYRNIQFGPDAMILDRARAVAVRGYDVSATAVRVRTRTGGDWLFMLDEGLICLMAVDGLQPLPSAQAARSGERCFARRDPNAS